MRRYELWPVLLVVALTGCSLAGSSSGSESSAITGERGQSDGSSIKFRTLYSFGYHQHDGTHPRSALYETGGSCTRVCSASFYGTTAAGGANNAGTIYDLYTGDLTGGSFSENTVMSFSPTENGSEPTGSLLAFNVKGFRGRVRSLITTASQGGAHDKGTVVASWANAVLAFDGHNGAFPTSGLTAGPRQPHANLFYTTTSKGGAHSLGAILAITLFHKKLTPKLIYSFTGKSDGAHPNSGLETNGETTGAQGGLYYGTTSGSKSVAATVYEFNRDLSPTITTLYTFESAKEGSEPSDVTVLPSKNDGPVLYGTTVEGGPSGYGTLYELKQTGSKYAMVKLHDFGGGTDGAYPQGAPSFAERYGTFKEGLYGVTANGGAHDCGTIFQYDFASSQYAVIHSFTCGKDGGHPEAGLIFDGLGLAGTTSVGGTYHHGTIFYVQ